MDTKFVLYLPVNKFKYSVNKFKYSVNYKIIIYICILSITLLSLFSFFYNIYYITNDNSIVNKDDLFTILGITYIILLMGISLDLSIKNTIRSNKFLMKNIIVSKYIKINICSEIIIFKILVFDLFSLIFLFIHEYTTLIILFLIIFSFYPGISLSALLYLKTKTPLYISL